MILQNRLINMLLKCHVNKVLHIEMTTCVALRWPMCSSIKYSYLPPPNEGIFLRTTCGPLWKFQLHDAFLSIFWSVRSSPQDFPIFLCVRVCMWRRGGGGGEEGESMEIFQIYTKHRS